MTLWIFSIFTLSIQHLLEKIGLDTDENGPTKTWQILCTPSEENEFSISSDSWLFSLIFLVYMQSRGGLPGRRPRRPEAIFRMTAPPLPLQSRRGQSSLHPDHPLDGLTDQELDLNLQQGSGAGLGLGKSERSGGEGAPDVIRYIIHLHRAHSRLYRRRFLQVIAKC